MILQSDVSYWWDFFPFALGAYAVAAFCAVKLCKLSRRSAIAVVIAATTATMYVPTLFPMLWRIFSGTEVLPITLLPDFHYIELTMQVAVGALAALAIACYCFVYGLCVVILRNAAYARPTRVFGYVRETAARHHQTDAVE